MNNKSIFEAMTKKKVSSLLKEYGSGSYELSVSEYIKNNFGNEMFENLKQEYLHLNESEKKEWASKLLNIIKQEFERE